MPRTISRTQHLAETAVRVQPIRQFMTYDHYMRSCDTLVSQVQPSTYSRKLAQLLEQHLTERVSHLQINVYRASRNNEQLYVMLMRLASLLVETVPRHKDHNPKDPRYARYKQVLTATYFPEAERLKQQLDAERVATPVARSTHRPSDATQLALSNLPEIDWASVQAPSPQQQLQLAGSSNGAAYDPSNYGSASGGAVGEPSTSTSGSSDYLPSYMPSSQQSLQKHVLYAPRGSTTSAAAQQAPQQRPRPRYPEFDAAPVAGIDLLWERKGSNGTAEPSAPDLPDMGALALTDGYPHPSPGPSLGPQEVQVVSRDPNSVPVGSTCSHPPPGDPSLAMPQADAPGGIKPVVKKADLRDVHISVALMEEFLHIANAHSRRGIEFCGILAGSLSGNDSTFTITTLIVPRQEGTTDTVSALNEEDIYEAQASRELYPLGWIHTHPTQTCFLSSVDIHTQCGYQTMLEEAVAIVMAPTDRHKKCGIFRLTTPGGLSMIQKCPLRGFHTHPPTETGQDVYELCGHVYLNPRVKHQVLDLR